MKIRLILFFLLLLSAKIYSEVPPGYYDNAAGKSGEELRSALETIISGHTSLSYKALWTAFRKTDDKADGTVWDMYSDVPGGEPSYVYTFSTDQCGNYSGEGSCYNREHSFPKSWFDDASPMYTDLFHLYPTDGSVNGKRSNYPFGEVESPTWTSTNGCELGTCSYEGYSGTVFEPIDEYKGDFSRTYFYMLTRYKSQISSWSSDMLSGDDFSVWAKNMLLEWHEKDPVSQKEIDRNNTIYEDYQHNRNPFIDHPEYACQIWGADCDTTGTVDPGDTTITEPEELNELKLTFDNDLEACTVVQVGGSVGWEYSSEYTCAYLNTYGASANESWLVTPVVNLDALNNEQFTFDVTSYNADKTIAACGAGQFELYYTNRFDGSTIDKTYWTRVISVDDVVLGERWDWVTVSVDVTEIRGSEVYFAFAHTCTDDGTTWQVDNVSLSGDVATSVLSPNEFSISLFPNPTTSSFALLRNVDNVQVITLSGKIVLSRNAVVANEVLDISGLNPGLYLVKVTIASEVVILKLVKQ